MSGLPEGPAWQSNDSWVPGPPHARPPGGWAGSGRFAFLAVVSIVIIAALLAFVLVPGRSPTAGADRPAGVSAVIAGSAPGTWDPALAGDAGTASTLAQVYEGLTAFDAESRVQPALAVEWTVDDGGRRLVFDLRPGITFSDGSPITSQDVVSSWLRLLDAGRRAPLASLLSDVEGATSYLRGEVGADAVGLHAEEGRVVVEFRRPAAYFVAVTASPSLAILPTASADGREGPILPVDLVVSGAYRPTFQSDTTIELEANPRYWAGVSALANVQLLTDLGGESPVALFEAGRVDYAGIGAFDASWVRYDPDLGPQLRRADALSVDYYGFDTSEAPFDDTRVRRAFSQAVDWDRIALLADAASDPATSLIPHGIAGRGDEDFSPIHDPEAARALLVAAGFPDGTSFPPVTMGSFGLAYDLAVEHELERELGVEVEVEQRPFQDYVSLLDADPPDIWSISWIADYPAAQDFLGLLLETGSGSNEGRWSDPAFDAALEAAAATEDPLEQERHYAEAQRIVRDEAPVVPVAYGESWSLSRGGLLGAQQSALGFLRFASLAWEAAP